MVFGLKALHDLNVMHRDLKTANVFLGTDGAAKLGDMYVSKVANNAGLNYTQTGTPCYASPEIWRDGPYTNQSDIWSLGCCFYEMLTLKMPFEAENMDLLYKKVLKGVYGQIPRHYTNDIAIMLRMLLNTRSDKRPTCDQIIQFPSFNKKVNQYFPNLLEQAEK